jgi:hypothetical protein
MEVWDAVLFITIVVFINLTSYADCTVIKVLTSHMCYINSVQYTLK